MIKPLAIPAASRPSIVTILGHVDHGKTTLLDTIRKTNLAQKESGGITQHIGVYQVTVNPNGESSSRATPNLIMGSRGIPSDNKKDILRHAQDDFVPQGHKITFIDTPGHVAFTKMRSQGAEVSDIAVLVVAANDGVMPQTIESIEQIKKARIPCIVAINKIDLPDVNIEKIKKQLSKYGLMLEEYGGEIPVVPLSAKTGKGIDKLLEMILLVSELHEIKDTSNQELRAVVIESSISKNKGIIATIIIRSGKLYLKDEIVCSNQDFRVRAILDWTGKQQFTIKSGDGAEILGWKKLPTVGSLLYNKKQIEISPKTVSELVEMSPALKSFITLPPTQTIEEEKIKIILKADTVGTLEAVLNSLPKKNIIVIKSEVGEINESDILLGKTTKALIIGFNLKPSDSVVKLAESEKTLLKTYNIIYELLDEIEEVIRAIKEGNLVNVLGTAKIQAIFKIKDQTIAGIKVTSGRIARGDDIKVVRGEKEIGRAKIKSLKYQKEDRTKAEQGTEAGIILSQNIDLLTGDSIISIG